MLEYDKGIEDKLVKTVLLNDEVPPILEQSIIAIIQLDEAELDSIDESEVSVLDKIRFEFGKSKKVDWYKLQRQNDNIRFIVNNILNKDVSYGIVRKESKQVKALYNLRKKLFMKDGLLYKALNSDKSVSKSQLVINDKCIDTLIMAYHDNHGHLGMDRIVQIIQSRFYCLKLGDKIKKAIAKCWICLARKRLLASNRTIAHERPISCRPM